MKIAFALYNKISFISITENISSVFTKNIKYQTILTSIPVLVVGISVEVDPVVLSVTILVVLSG